MYERIAILALRLADPGNTDGRIEAASALRIEQGRTEAAYTSAPDATPEQIGRELDKFLPGDVRCLAYEAEYVRDCLASVSSRAAGLSFVDAGGLARILLPELPDHCLETVCEHLDLISETDGARALARLLDHLIERACSLPPVVIDEMNLLLLGAGNSPEFDLAAAGKDPPARDAHAQDELAGVRDFFQRVSREVQRRDPHSLPGRLQDIFAEVRMPRFGATRNDDTPPISLDPDSIAETLARDGQFAARLANYECRDGQVAMARSVCTAFNDGKHLLVEAGTGIGKSLAYLVPAVQWALTNHSPVVISTNTKNLQSQLFAKDIPLIKEVLDIDFKAALIKGRMNYLCLRKLLYTLRQAEHELNSFERMDVLHALSWAASTVDGDFSNSSILDRPGATGLRARLSSRAEECARRDCPHRRRCFLQKARAKAQVADIVVANHSLVFAEANINTSALPPYSDIIFDEAHNLEEAATRHFSVELSRSRLRFITHPLWRRRGRHGGGSGLLPILSRHVESRAFTGTAEQRERAAAIISALQDAVESCNGVVAGFFEALGGLLSGRGGPEMMRMDAGERSGVAWDRVTTARAEMSGALLSIRDRTKQLSDLLREIDGDELPFHQDFIGGLTSAEVGLLEFGTDVDFVLAADDADFVYWVESATAHAAPARAWAAPVVVGKRLAADFYNQKRTIVFSSATLTVKGAFDFVKKRLGLDALEAGRCLEMNAGSPFDYERQCAVMVPMFLSEPDSDDGDYGEALGALLAEVFERTRGRGMALFTSYSMLRKATRVLSESTAKSGLRVLAQGMSGSRENITTLFRHDVGSVLMGTHSFWEGVDLVGETLSCLVLARLPFAVFTDPIQAARGEKVEAEGGSSFREYALPNAVIRFRQGFGRLIRHRSDRGVVIVTDRRVITKSYGSWFQKSLPVRSVPFHDREEFLNALESFLAEVV